MSGQMRVPGGVCALAPSRTMSKAQFIQMLGAIWSLAPHSEPVPLLVFLMTRGEEAITQAIWDTALRRLPLP